MQWLVSATPCERQWCWCADLEVVRAFTWCSVQFFVRRVSKRPCKVAPTSVFPRSHKMVTTISWILSNCMSTSRAMMLLYILLHILPHSVPVDRVLGPTADDLTVQAHTYHGTPRKWITLLSALKEAAGPEASFTYVKGCDRMVRRLRTSCNLQPP